MEAIQQTNILEDLEKTYSRYGSIEQKSLCERFFRKSLNKNFDASVGVLKAILVDSTLENRKDIEGFEFNENEGNEKMLDEECLDNGRIKSTILTEALRILRCTKLLRLDGRVYSINTKLWQEEVRYRFKKNTVLSNIAPLILSYVRNDVTFTPNEFFKKLDPLVSHALKPASYHNDVFKKEAHVYWAMGEQESIIIKVSETQTIEIDPIAIEIDEGQKWIRYEDEDTNTHLVPIASVEI